MDVLGATDFWFRYEWQHRGSPHVHGLAWLPNAPDVEKLHTAKDTPALLDVIEQITSYVDNLVTTMNPGIPAGGNNIQDAVPQEKTKPHVFNKSYSEIEDFNMDLVNFVATASATPDVLLLTA